MKTTRVMIAEQGEPQVMQLEEVDVGAPGAGEVQLEQSAIGLNYMDIYQRGGSYKLQFPSPLGLEAAGVVTAVGDGVDSLAVGDRVVYGGAIGAYAGIRNAPAARMIRIPDGISDEVAAAVLMKGMTVEYLLERCFKVGPGMTALFWAASGGVGQLAGQWGKHLGARMIGVTSGAENCAAILDVGYDVALDRKTDNVAGRVRELTDGKGVPVVYDSVGKASFEASIDSLAPMGYFVSFGATTGAAPDVSPFLLQTKGSLYFTRPTLANYVGPRDLLEHSANRVFEMVQSGAISVHINQRFALNDIVEAHTRLESGATTGSTIITP